MSPDPGAVAYHSQIARLFGKAIIFTRIPLTRQDLPAPAGEGASQTRTFRFQNGLVMETNHVGPHLRVTTFKETSVNLGDGRWMLLDGTNIIITTIQPEEIRESLPRPQN